MHRFKKMVGEPNILAIESSCDDTSVAIFTGNKLLSNVVSSQLDHEELGGVVPELASRAHVQVIQSVMQKALKEAHFSIKQINCIAYTQGPGLLGSLIVGAGFAKGLAMGLRVPTIGVNHMEGHVLAHFIEEPYPRFPFICLTVSGGHTQLSIYRNYLDSEILGQTIDDAAGEAFDKTGKMLGLPYPSGPLIDRYANLGEAKFEFAQSNVNGLDFSFSGFKTSVLYFLKKKMRENDQFIMENHNDLCASIQSTIVDMLISKIKLAIDMTGIKEIAIAGGVSANSGLRKRLNTLSQEYGLKSYTVPIRYCTDNAAMIGITAYHMYKQGQFTPLDAPVLTRQTSF